MTTLKYISPLFEEIYTKRHITYQGSRLKTVFIINIIDLFLNRWLSFNKDNMKLNSRLLKWLYGSSYPKYIDYLIDRKFIYLWKNYSAGLKAKTYRLTDAAKAAGYLTANVDMPVKINDKMRTINTVYNEIEDAVKNKLILDLYRVDIDLKGAKAWLDENIERSDKAHTVNLATCNKIHSKDIYYSFDNYGRFHTNYTILKKEIRSRFLRFGNAAVREIDITNSQPFFLYVLMRESGFDKFDGFDDDVLSGKIYERLRDLSGKTRKEVKVNVYSVLFGRNMTANYWNELFCSLYPNVYAWVRDYKVKHKTYKAIAQNLQRIEAEFMFGTLIPRVMSYDPELPLITIHDSIIIPDYAYGEVRRIFDDALAGIVSLKKIPGAYDYA